MHLQTSCVRLYKEKWFINCENSICGCARARHVMSALNVEDTMIIYRPKPINRSRKLYRVNIRDTSVSYAVKVNILIGPCPKTSNK